MLASAFSRIDRPTINPEIRSTPRLETITHGLSKQRERERRLEEKWEFPFANFHRSVYTSEHGTGARIFLQSRSFGAANLAFHTGNFAKTFLIFDISRGTICLSRQTSSSTLTDRTISALLHARVQRPLIDLPTTEKFHKRVSPSRNSTVLIISISVVRNCPTKHASPLLTPCHVSINSCEIL